MKRLLPLAIVLAVFAFAGTTQAVNASRFAELNADLAPVNVALRDDVPAFALALARASSAQQNLSGSPTLRINATRNYAAKLSQALDDLAASEKAVAADAALGLKVLDQFQVEGCFSHFYALEYALYSAWAETMTELATGVPPDAANTGIYLGGFSTVDLTPLTAGSPIDQEWTRASKQCGIVAQPSPA